MEVFAARLKCPLLRRSVSMCVGDPLSVQKKNKSWTSANGLPRPHTSPAMLVEWLQPQSRDRKGEVSRGQMEGWIPRVLRLHSTSPS